MTPDHCCPVKSELLHITPNGRLLTHQMLAQLSNRLIQRLVLVNQVGVPAFYFVGNRWIVFKLQFIVDPVGTQGFIVPGQVFILFQGGRQLSNSR